jgi:hypothetical protein
MDPTLIFGLISLGLNTTLQLLNTQGVTKADYSQLSSTLERAFVPLISMIPGWIKGGASAPTAVNDVLAAYATVIGVLNALKSQPGLPAPLLVKIEEYIAGAQDGTMQFVVASKGFDLGQFAPVAPMPPA